ncbi:2'-5' RNA ligase family protein [Risungbinella massiliensis]|uniref:2'-5' RNA ligase family protein n=1 Tax=Risungbinella massiliensis TaxID=1329796 RepID=UPI0005CBC252|nr:2'-5' RNA ligase family protein [Risungbinella massiliensis]
MFKIVTQYVDNICQWEKWQQKYRFGVLLLFPPNPLLAKVNELRERYDPKSSAACNAHISLTIPVPRPLSMADWNELEIISSGIKSFSIRYGPLKNYLPHPGVCLAIEPQEELDKIRIALEKASVFDGAQKRQFPFSAHMTIAEFITIEQTKELMIKLKDVAPIGDFICTSVSYAVPDSNFRFTERARLKLSDSPKL